MRWPIRCWQRRRGCARLWPAADIEGLSGAECARLAEELAVTEKCCAALRLLAAARAVEAGAHNERGFGQGAAWLARHSGTTGAQARQALETAEGLADCPDTKAAFLAGDISLSQAGEITRAEADTAGAETELLPVARHSTDPAARPGQRAPPSPQRPGPLRTRQFQARQFRHWHDRDGMVRFAGALPPETGLPLVRRVEAAALRARRAARAAGAARAGGAAGAAGAAGVAGARPSASRPTPPTPWPN